MRIRVGTSGFAYKEWKGTFYPEKIASTKMLAYYAVRLPTVEINYTFYRAPTPKILEGWAAQTPDPFKLTLKAPRRITHDQRLRDVAEPVARFFETAGVLGPKLGAVLVQLPPYHRKDAPLLRDFVATLPEGACAAFEFRHASWFDDEVLEILRSTNLALCIADSEKTSAPVEMTADYAYFRLRDEGYTPDDLAKWADVIREKTAACREVYVYFKHEDAGKGPEFARILRERLGC